MYFIISVILAICIWFLLARKVSKHLNFRINQNLIYIIITFCFVIAIICSFLYLIYDSKGFEYGLGCNFCNKKLPNNLTPIIDRYDSFTLNDNDDLELIGTGFGYKKSSFIIKNIISYGYNETSIIVKCTDSLNVNKYLISCVKKHNNKIDNQHITFKEIDYQEYNRVYNSYKWTELNIKKTSTIRFMKLICFIVGLLSLFIMILYFNKYLFSKFS
jgi:hypothetical protein